MEAMKENQDWEFEYANMLPGRGQCECGYTEFSIKIYKNLKTSGVVFRCINSKCRKRYPIRINSFFSSFPRVRLDPCLEIVKTFICLELYININNFR